MFIIFFIFGFFLLIFFIFSRLKSDVKQTRKITTTFKKTVINIIENQPGKKLTTPNNLKEKVKIIIINKTRKVMKSNYRFKIYIL